MARKQSSKKPLTKTRKTPKPDAVVPAAPAESKPKKTRERDPRLPKPGTVIVRPYKGREIRVKVLEDTFECEGAVFRSLSALAAKITEADSINGYLFFKLTQPKSAEPKAGSARETETPAAPAKARAPKRTEKVRRAGRDPQPMAPTENAPAIAPAAESATA